MQSEPLYGETRVKPPDPPHMESKRVAVKPIFRCVLTALYPSQGYSPQTLILDDSKSFTKHEYKSRTKSPRENRVTR